MSAQTNVLFVCLGNICRSTMAEGIFQHISTTDSEVKGLVGLVDSCGTGSYHVGDEPDDRTMSTLEEHGVNTYHHLARKLKSSDFDKFDYIFAMDRSNLSDLQRMKRGDPDSKAKVMLFGEYSGTGKVEIVEDPYYGGDHGFTKAFEQCERFSKNFLKELASAKGQ